MTGSFMGRGNQYIQLLKLFLYHKVPTIGKQLLTLLQGVGFGPWTSGVGGECVTTVLQWSLS